MTLTQDLLKELFDYRDGELYRKKYRSSNAQKGDLAGYVQKNGYRAITINGKIYRIHRLIFLYHHGFLPEFLDHIDGNRLNNSVDNLRGATSQENNRNVKKHKSMNGKATSSEFKGVYWHKRDKKWQAQIRIDGKKKHLGSFDSELKAAKAYNNAGIEHFGEFVKLNDIGD